MRWLFNTCVHLLKWVVDAFINLPACEVMRKMYKSLLK